MSSTVFASSISGNTNNPPNIGNGIQFLNSQSNLVTPSSLTVYGGTTVLDNVTGTSQSSFFYSAIVFQLNTPIYTDDDSDVIQFTVNLGSNNESKPFNIICSLTNLGQSITSPVYPVTVSSSGLLQIDVNKWFMLRSPGSFYTFSVNGFNIQS